MTFTKISIALFAASAMVLSGTAAMAGPLPGPQDFQNKPNPKFPGPGPKDFKAPPKKQNNGNGNGNFNPAFGIILGVGAIAAAAAAADDDEECWKEKHKGKTVIVCTEG